MKNTELSGRLTDFFILTAIFALIAFGVRFIEGTVFADEDYGGELIVISRAMPTEYTRYLGVGDVLYDSVTKRRVGEVSDIFTEKNDDGSSVMEIRLSASRLPRGGALRSRELYIEISEVIMP